MRLSERIQPCESYGDEPAIPGLLYGIPAPPTNNAIPQVNSRAARGIDGIGLFRGTTRAFVPFYAHPYSGSPVRLAAAGTQSRIHGHRPADAHAGHRRHGGDLQRGGRRSVAGAAVP